MEKLERFGAALGIFCTVIWLMCCLGDSKAAMLEGLHPARIITGQMETLPTAFPSVDSTLDPEDMQLGQNCIQTAGGGAVLNTQVRSS